MLIDNIYLNDTSNVKNFPFSWQIDFSFDCGWINEKGWKLFIDRKSTMPRNPVVLKYYHRHQRGHKKSVHVHLNVSLVCIIMMMITTTIYAINSFRVGQSICISCTFIWMSKCCICSCYTVQAFSLYLCSISCRNSHVVYINVLSIKSFYTKQSITWCE